MEIPIRKELKDAKRILVSGAGGGFDIYSGIPLYFYLTAMGKEVVLGNYSFSLLQACKGERIGPTGWRITPKCRDMDYFPEKFMADWFDNQEMQVEIIGYEKSGVIPLAETLNTIIAEKEIDTLIMVDGGTDSLMKGNEAGLGTPKEDATSIAAGHAIQLERKYLVALGFGIDHFHGVCHAQFLENVAEQIRFGGYKGCSSVSDQDEEGKRFLELVNYANSRALQHKSIVANSVASAIEGQFGDHHTTYRTRGSRLFINPLMGLYWFFDLDKIAQKLQYLSMIEHSQTEAQVVEAISTFRKVIQAKPWEDMPY